MCTKLNTITNPYKGFREPQIMCMTEQGIWYSDVMVRLLPQPTHITSTTANTIHTRLHNNFTARSQLFSVVELT